MKRNGLIGVAVLCGWCAGAGALDFSYRDNTVEQFDLSRTVRMGLDNNTELLTAEQDVLIAAQQVNEARFQFLPQPSVSGSASKFNAKAPMILPVEYGAQLINPSDYENFYSVRMMLTQPLFRGRRIVNGYNMAKAGFEKARSLYEEIRRRVERDLKRAFYETLYLKQKQAETARWLGLMSGQRQTMQLNSWNAIAADGIIENMTGRMEEATRDLNTQKLNLVRLLNRETGENIDVDDQFEALPATVDLNKALVWAMEYRPELKTQIYKAQMESIAVNLAKTRNYPSVDLGVNYDIVGNTFPLESNSWAATLAVRLPISYDLWTKLKTRRAEQRQGDLVRASVEDTVRMEVRQAYENLVFWQSESEKRKNTCDRLEKTYQSALKTDKLGLDALQAGQAVFLSRSTYLEAVKNQLAARAEIEWAIGQELAYE
ncbi:MAG: TolC family protein [Elusimicrobiaceae bacterium]|nr:TolC family protein [Elusimicrobiaceae bacterium]